MSPTRIYSASGIKRPYHPVVPTQRPTLYLQAPLLHIAVTSSLPQFRCWGRCQVSLLQFQASIWGSETDTPTKCVHISNLVSEVTAYMLSATNKTVYVSGQPLLLRCLCIMMSTRGSIVHTWLLWGLTIAITSPTVSAWCFCSSNSSTASLLGTLCHRWDNGCSCAYVPTGLTGKIYDRRAFKN